MTAGFLITLLLALKFTAIIVFAAWQTREMRKLRERRAQA